MADLTKAELLKALKGLSSKDLEKIGLRSMKDTPISALTGEERKEAEAAIKENLRLLDVELRLSNAIGDRVSAGQQATEWLKNFNELTAEAATRSGDLEEQQREVAEQLGMTVDQLNAQAEAAQKAADKWAELGPVGQKAAKQSQKAFEDIGTKIGLLSPGTNRLYKGFLELGDIANNPKGLAGIAEGFKSAINPTTVMLGLTSKIISETFKLAVAQDKANAAFARTTGQGQSANKEIAALSTEFNNFGITADDAQKSMAVVTTQMANVAGTSLESRKEMGFLVAGMEKLGVAGSDVAESQVNFIKGMGMTQVEAAKTLKKVAGLSKIMGKSSADLTKDLNASMKTLAVYGPKSTKIFKKLAAMSTAAGVSVNSLLGIAGKFDTFAGAAETTGKLNAILGTTMSSTEMLMMSEEERLETLMKQVQMSGQAFSDMNKFEQMAIANAAGIEDMNEANKLFSMSFDEYEEMNAKAEAQAAAEKEVADRMKEAMDIGQKLQMLMVEFAIALEPVVSWVSWLAQGILDLSNSMGGWLVPLVGGIMAITLLGKALAFAIPFMGAAAPAGKSAGKGIEYFGKGAAAAGKGLLKGSVGMVAFGGSLMTVGLGVLMITGGVALMVYALTGLFTLLFDNFEVFGLIVVQMMGMAAALAAVGAGGFLAGIGLLAAGFGMGAFALGLAFVSKKKLGYMADIFTSLSQIGGEGIQGTLENAKDFINSLSINPLTIQPILTNMALITTGTSSAGSAIPAAQLSIQGILMLIAKLTEMFGKYFPADTGSSALTSDKKDKERVFKLDKEATKAFWEDAHAKYHE